MVLALATGCLGPVASLYPPAPDAPAEPVWVVDHGWHTGLVVARSSLTRGLLPEQDDLPAAHYLEVGWGDADFYRARDPGVAQAIRAAVGSRAAVVHVVGLPTRPDGILAGRDVVEIRLSRPGFEALARFVDDVFDRGGQRPAPALGAGLYGASAFYPARGRYHLLNTCNTWVARALRAAGVPITPVYAITAGNLMWQVRRLRESSGRRRSTRSRRLPHHARGRPVRGSDAAGPPSRARPGGAVFRGPGWVRWVRLGLLAGLLTSACETAMYSMEWRKPGVDARQSRHDAYECQRHAQMSPPAEDDARLSARRRYIRCMESRGYTLVP